VKKIVLKISGPFGRRDVELVDELTIGRTDASDVNVDDGGLSRRNTTFFRDGDAVFAVDENSLNGTFVGGDRIGDAPVRVYDGDNVRIGSETEIKIEFAGRPVIATETEKAAVPAPPAGKTGTKTQPKPVSSKSNQSRSLLIMAGVSTMLILVAGGIAFIIAGRYSGGGSTGGKTSGPMTATSIPRRVIDPLGGEDPEDIEDLIASWESEEAELDVTTVKDVNVSETETNVDEAELNVPASLLAEQKRKAFEQRSGLTGISPAGLIVPAELRGDGVIKQKAKLRQMNSTGYQQPMDFSDLAKMRLSGELIEMPMATQSYYLEVGGSASTGPFKAFSFQTDETPIFEGSPKHRPLADIATKFGVSLGDGDDRKQIRMRLLRMFNKRAKPVLLELAAAYHQRFGRPLRVTSLTRSMDYQITLNQTNKNSFIVRGEGSLPPHTSGCAFDLARKHMNVEEQNFVMEKLAEMERARRLDALIEYGLNACFHVFIYHDGIAPNM
jgi:hypothetical protein